MLIYNNDLTGWCRRCFRQSFQSPKLLPATSNRSNLRYLASYTYHTSLWKPISRGKKPSPQVNQKPGTPPEKKTNASQKISEWFFRVGVFPGQKKNPRPAEGISVFVWVFSSVCFQRKVRTERWELFHVQIHVGSHGGLGLGIPSIGVGKGRSFRERGGAWCRWMDVTQIFLLKSHEFYIFSPEIPWNPRKMPKHHPRSSVTAEFVGCFYIFIPMQSQSFSRVGLGPKVCTVFRVQNVIAGELWKGWPPIKVSFRFGVAIFWLLGACIICKIGEKRSFFKWRERTTNKRSTTTKQVPSTNKTKFNFKPKFHQAKPNKECTNPKPLQPTNKRGLSPEAPIKHPKKRS